MSQHPAANMQHMNKSECLVCTWQHVESKLKYCLCHDWCVGLFHKNKSRAWPYVYVCFRVPTGPWRMQKGSVGNGKKGWGPVGTPGPGAWPRPLEELGQLRTLQPPPHSTPTHTQVSIYRHRLVFQALLFNWMVKICVRITSLRQSF